MTAAGEHMAAALDVWKVLTYAETTHAHRLAVVDCFNPTATDPNAGANVITYQGLCDHVLLLTGHLRLLGVGKGNRVAVMLRNCAEVGCAR